MPPPPSLPAAVNSFLPCLKIKAGLPESSRTLLLEHVFPQGPSLCARTAIQVNTFWSLVGHW